MALKVLSWPILLNFIPPKWMQPLDFLFCSWIIKCRMTHRNDSSMTLPAAAYSWLHTVYVVSTQCQAKFVEIDGSKSKLNVRTILIMELFPFSIQGQFVYHIAQTIFTCMDKNNRLKCRQVSTEWKQCIDTKTNLWSGVSTLNYIKAAEEGRLDICKVCSSVFSASTLSRFASVVFDHVLRSNNSLPRAPYPTVT